MKQVTFQATEGTRNGYEGPDRTTLAEAAKDAATSGDVHRIDEFDGDMYVASFTSDGRNFADHTGQPT